jgi:hypothetical protein
LENAVFVLRLGFASLRMTRGERAFRMTGGGRVRRMTGVWAVGVMKKVYIGDKSTHFILKIYKIY